MGGVNTTIDNSEQIVRETQNIMNKLLIENSSKCASDNKSAQEINIGNMNFKNCADVSIGTNQFMTVSNDFRCLADNDTNTKILQDFKNSMIQASKAPGNPINTGLSVGPMGASVNFFSVDTQINNSKKTFDYLLNNTNEQTIKNISTCSSDNLNTQLQNLGNITVECPLGGKVDLTKLSQSMVSNSIANCTAQNINSIAAELKSDINVVQDTTTGGRTTSVGIGTIVGGVVCLIIGCLLLWKQCDYIEGERVNCWTSFLIFGIFFILFGIAGISLGAAAMAGEKIPGIT